MQFLQDPKIDFMRVRRFVLPISAILVTLAVFDLFVQKNLNIGVDFAGGTQLIAKFGQTPDVDALRSSLQSDGIDDAVIQRYGAPEANEVMIKMRAAQSEEEAEEASENIELTPGEDNAATPESRQRAKVEASFDRLLNAARGAKFDLNLRGRDSLASLLLSNDPDGRRAELDEIQLRDYYAGVADAIMETRKTEGLIATFAQLDGAGVSPEVRKLLERETSPGKFAILAVESVGPQIGAELRRRGVLAVVLSLIGMLGYIWWRFEFRFGVGALVALVHDVLITLGLFAIFGHEFNLTTIAAFLTVVGYSVNDTVVVFDRVRENLRRSRRQPLVDVLNTSINQTLSRTVLTSGTTLLAVGSLYFVGGEVIRGFAFVLLIGVVIGTYSSIFVASPMVLIWERFFSREVRARRTDARSGKSSKKNDSKDSKRVAAAG